MITGRDSIRFGEGHQPGGGFTLIEIMMVVAIMGVILVAGVPPFVKAARREGMRRAVTEIVDCCRNARIAAVTSGKPSALVINPRAHTVHGGRKTDGIIPQEITILSVGVNFVELGDADLAQAMFYPTGISDEFEITLQGPNGDIEQINLDIVTGTPIAKGIR